jgi:hypothetical protein
MRNSTVAQNEPNHTAHHEPSVGVHERPRLLPYHRHELEVGSSIAPAVIAARPYRSVTTAEALDLGFADYQAGPGLAAQLWTTAGRRGNWILKRDQPRLKDNGQPQKYENPETSLGHLDIHPDAYPLLRDPSVRLWFTEGHKKADALWSRGEACISLTGVYMFMRGKLILPDFDDIALEGRSTYVCFDSDVRTKPDVALARLRLCEALRRRKAIVNIVTLPEVL